MIFIEYGDYSHSYFFYILLMQFLIWVIIVVRDYASWWHFKVIVAPLFEVFLEFIYPYFCLFSFPWKALYSSWIFCIKISLILVTYESWDFRLFFPILFEVVCSWSHTVAFILFFIIVEFILDELDRCYYNSWKFRLQ